MKLTDIITPEFFAHSGLKSRDAVISDVQFNEPSYPEDCGTVFAEVNDSSVILRASARMVPQTAAVLTQLVQFSFPKVDGDLEAIAKYLTSYRPVLVSVDAGNNMLYCAQFTIKAQIVSRGGSIIATLALALNKLMLHATTIDTQDARIKIFPDVQSWTVSCKGFFKQLVVEYPSEKERRVLGQVQTEVRDGDIIVLRYLE